MVLGGTFLQRTSLRDQALAALRQVLITGQLEPGRIYSAAQLAAELGVSNSPVREALLALVDDGLMEAVPNRGYRTVLLSERDMAEIIELRLFLEVPAHGFAAERGISDQIPLLQELVDQIERSAEDGDLTANLAADRQFHLTVIEAAGNRRLAETVERLRDQTRLHNLNHLAETGELRASAAEHRPLLSALAERDRARTETLVRAHLMHLYTDWVGPVSAGAEPRPGSSGQCSSGTR